LLDVVARVAGHDELRYADVVGSGRRLGACDFVAERGDE